MLNKRDLPLCRAGGWASLTQEAKRAQKRPERETAEAASREKQVCPESCLPWICCFEWQTTLRLCWDYDSSLFSKKEVGFHGMFFGWFLQECRISQWMHELYDFLFNFHEPFGSFSVFLNAWWAYLASLSQHFIFLYISIYIYIFIYIQYPYDSQCMIHITYPRRLTTQIYM